MIPQWIAAVNTWLDWLFGVHTVADRAVANLVVGSVALLVFYGVRRAHANRDATVAREQELARTEHELGQVSEGLHIKQEQLRTDESHRALQLPAPSSTFILTDGAQIRQLVTPRRSPTVWALPERDGPDPKIHATQPPTMSVNVQIDDTHERNVPVQTAHTVGARIDLLYEANGSYGVRIGLPSINPAAPSAHDVIPLAHLYVPPLATCLTDRNICPLT